MIRRVSPECVATLHHLHDLVHHQKLDMKHYSSIIYQLEVVFPECKNVIIASYILTLLVTVNLVSTDTELNVLCDDVVFSDDGLKLGSIPSRTSPKKGSSRPKTPVR